MASINHDVFDQGLTQISSTGTVLHLCSAEPADYAAALATSLANKTGITVAAPSDLPAGGRQVVVPEVTDGDTTGNAQATHWALLDVTLAAERLLATEEIDTPIDIVSGNMFATESFIIAIPDPL